MLVSVICTSLLRYHHHYLTRIRLSYTGQNIFSQVLKNSETTLIIAKSCQENKVKEQLEKEKYFHPAISEK